MRWLLIASLAACGDDIHPRPDAISDDGLLVQLRSLANVRDATEQPTQTPGYHYIVLHFVQPVDHAAPDGPSFLQEVSLLHRDTAAPLIVHTSGYWDYYLDKVVELTALLDANQISIEHRFFGTSRPAPADWTKLTIEQMAADEHAIVSALRTVYTGKAISTGGSKGGMTAVFYRRFYPDDVDGTVPYVAPISYAAPDPRYPAFIATLGPSACHQAVQAAAIDMLKNRRAAMESRAQSQAQSKGYAYTRVLLGPAVESAIESLEWSFWQYYGVDSCPNVPAASASDDAMFTFLDTISPIADSDDEQVGQFEAYYYQSYFQLGYPDDGTTYLKPYYKYMDADYAGALPTAQPTYDMGAAMHDIDNFVEHAGSRLVFVYGQWDPWTGGAYMLGSATDSLALVQAQGTHGSHLTRLAGDDMQAAFTKLATWTGVTPNAAARTPLAEPRAPRVPPGMARALRARRVSP
jgi:hypothetical protein